MPCGWRCTRGRANRRMRHCLAPVGRSEVTDGRVSRPTPRVGRVGGEPGHDAAGHDAAGHEAGRAAAVGLTPAQQRTLAVLRRDPEPVVFDQQWIDDLTATARDALAGLSARLGGAQVWVSKGMLANVHGCEVQYLQPDEFTWRPSTAAGFVAHLAIELALNWPGDPVPGEVVDAAIARLADQPDARGAYMAGLTPADHAELRGRAVDRTTKFLQEFPPIPGSAHPVLESSIRWSPPGTITLAGKVDLVLGRPQGTESRQVLIDLKTGGRSFHHRDDLRFYALVQTLRTGVPPRRLVTYYFDEAACDPEDVTTSVLEAALARTLAGIERHVELHAEARPPVLRVGASCRWCPIAADCTEGSAYLRALAGDDDTAP